MGGTGIAPTPNCYEIISLSSIFKNKLPAYSVSHNSHRRRGVIELEWPHTHLVQQRGQGKMFAPNNNSVQVVFETSIDISQPRWAGYVISELLFLGKEICLFIYIWIYMLPFVTTRHPKAAYNIYKYNHTITLKPENMNIMLKYHPKNNYNNETPKKIN